MVAQWFLQHGSHMHNLSPLACVFELFQVTRNQSVGSCRILREEQDLQTYTFHVLCMGMNIVQFRPPSHAKFEHVKLHK